MPPHDDVPTVTELHVRQSVHEAVCSERQGKILSAIDELKATVADQGRSIVSLASQMGARTAGARTLREAVAYLIAVASIIAALYSGGLVRVGH